MIVGKDQMPPDPGANDKIATQRATLPPTVREQASLALNLAVTASHWIEGNQNLIGAMSRLITLLCDHVQDLEEQVGIPEDKRMKAVVAARAKAAVEKVTQPPPQGENLIDPPPSPLTITSLLEAIDAHAAAIGQEVQLLTEDESGARKWSTRDDLAAGNLHGTPLKIGPKPATQFVNGAKPPKMSDPPPPAVGQPPEKPA
jgi:hypothetical protein